MLEILKNKSSFSDSELVQMVKRENNSKRNYLLVNSLQAKHVPADPLRTVSLFRQLAQEVKRSTGTEKVLFIGFAETATAVGAAVSSEFEGAYYIHTTRECISGSELIAEFREEHSHAAEQLLYCDDWERIISGTEHIIFAEDEITTGKTIMNFINALKTEKKVPDDMKFSACSILNGMSPEREAELKKQGVSFIWLVKHSASPDSDEVYSFTEKPGQRSSEFRLTEKKVPGMLNPRRGVQISLYKEACRSLAETAAESIPDGITSAAVIGTEECMYPAIELCRLLKEKGVLTAVSHSSTRSPIVAENRDGYPLRTRHSLKSFYDSDRKTYIYNSDLTSYDLVIAVTDSEKSDYDFTSFSEAFSECRDFLLVRWVSKL